STCGGDDSPAQHPRLRVEHRGLPWGGAGERQVEGQPAIRKQGRDRRGVIAEARFAAHWARRRSGDERDVAKLDLADGELLAPSDREAVRGRVDLQDVPRPRLAKVPEARAL